MRRLLIPVLFPTLILAACSTTQPAADITPTADLSPSPTPPPSCVAVNVKPTPGPQQPSLFPPVSADDWTQGRAGAAVTMLVYSDFQCPSCADLAKILGQLESDHPDDLRLIFRYFPVTSDHDKAALSAQAAEAAGLQGKFWQMHDLLFTHQAEWLTLTPSEFESWVSFQAASLDLDGARFQSDWKSESVAARIQKAWDFAISIPLPPPPVLLINGQVYTIPVNYDNLDSIVRMIILGERQFTSCPPVTIDPLKQYVATLKTEKGDIRIMLFPDKAPFTVNNYVFLARNGWFDRITFHRVIPGFIAQTGDPSGTGSGNPGYFIRNEIDATLKYDQPGLVGMANSGADTNGSQFFITLAPTPHLDGKYTIFGRVISGMDVVQQLTPRDPQPGTSLPPGDILLTVTIEEK